MIILLKRSIIIGIFFLAGCSSIYTSVEQYKKIDNFVKLEKYSEAALTLEKSKAEYFDKKDRVQYWTDLGLLYHYANQDSLAIQNLSLADFAIEELYTTSVSKGVTSMVLNDNALDYSGEDYENLYINIFKALSFYRLGDSEGALVEIRRLTEKLNVLDQKYEKELSALIESKEIKTEVKDLPINFYSSALAHYISAILFFNDGLEDDARISKDFFYDAFDNQKNLYDFPKLNLDKLLAKSDSQKIAFISFLGRAPSKYEYLFKIDTFKDLAIISIISNNIWKEFSTIKWEGLEGGLHSKFAIPKMMKRECIIGNVEIIVNGVHKTNLHKIESIENIALETFKREETITFLKSLARTITKAMANEAVNKELDKNTGGGDWGELTRWISGELINTTENADLRYTHYFPSYAYAGNLEISPGIYNIEIIYKDKYDNIIISDKFKNYQVNETNKIDLIETVFLQ